MDPLDDVNVILFSHTKSHTFYNLTIHYTIHVYNIREKKRDREIEKELYIRIT